MATKDTPEPVANEPGPKVPITETEKPLSASEFRIYNQMAERMDSFHNHFRAQWTSLHTTAVAGNYSTASNRKQFIKEGLHFCHMLTMHHDIEETYYFPLLARKMPEFRKQESLLEQHRGIHRGLDQLQEYFEQCAKGKKEEGGVELDLGRVKDLMNGFGTVLWAHLDDEVKTLGAKNMRKYWTVEEMREITV